MQCPRLSAQVREGPRMSAGLSRLYMVVRAWTPLVGVYIFIRNIIMITLSAGIFLDISTCPRVSVVFACFACFFGSIPQPFLFLAFLWSQLRLRI